MSKQTAVVTGADHGLGFALASRLLARGWNVVAGRYATGEKQLDSLAGEYGSRLTIVSMDVSNDDSVAAAGREILAQRSVVDLVINNAAVLGNEGLENTIGDGLDYDSIMATMSINSLGALRVVQALLPGLEQSELRRLCFISSEAGSVTKSYRPDWYGYCMSKCALNMGISIVFNDLRPKGYTFRVYHPGWMQTFMKGTQDSKAKYTPDQAAALALEYFLDLPVDEDRLVMRDDERNEWPW